MIARHLQDAGAPPRRIVMDRWAAPTLRAGGEDIAHALALMGVAPLWDDASTRVTGFAITPQPRLEHPRIDVTVRISGAFRDTFPSQVALLDAAARAIAAAVSQEKVVAAAVEQGSLHALGLVKPGPALEQGLHQLVGLVAGGRHGLELHRVELQLAQAQKMQAIGQLAGGVAHDFNNLLTAIQLRLDELLHRHPVGDPSYEGLNEIRQTGVRAADLVRKLLAFSRKQTVQREVLDLGELISEFEVLLRRLLREIDQALDAYQAHGVAAARERTARTFEALRSSTASGCASSRWKVSSSPRVAPSALSSSAISAVSSVAGVRPRV